MRDAGRTPATRSALLRVRRRLERVRRGVELLTRKRRALVRELFRLAGPAVDVRARVARRAESAYPALLRALAVHGLDGVRTLGRPERGPGVRVVGSEVWGVGVARIDPPPPLRRTLPARGTSAAGTGPAAATAADEFETLTELLLEAAAREMQIRRLAAALAGTTRLVGTLEQRVAPTLEGERRRLRATLEERERSERVALKLLLRGRTRS